MHAHTNETHQKITLMQVTPNAWKWPALWPYTPDYFDRPDESEDEKAFKTAKMAPCLEGSSREALVAHYSRFLAGGSAVLEIGEWVGGILAIVMYALVVGEGGVGGEGARTGGSPWNQRLLLLPLLIFPVVACVLSHRPPAF